MYILGGIYLYIFIYIYNSLCIYIYIYIYWGVRCMLYAVCCIYCMYKLHCFLLASMLALWANPILVFAS